jgi:hypothetical protein
MDEASLKLAAEIYEMSWTAHYDEAEAKLVPLQKKHPVFDLLYSEVSDAPFSSTRKGLMMR